MFLTIPLSLQVVQNVGQGTPDGNSQSMSFLIELFGFV